MRNFLFLSVLLIAVSGCSCKKGPSANKEAMAPTLYGTTWELEFISGPRITFEGLYPEEKPTLVLQELDSKFGGNSSCNAYSGPFTLKGNSIHFGQAIKTMRFCEGGGEQTFLNMLGKVNKFEMDSDGKLLLLQNDVPMMRFQKIN